MAKVFFKEVNKLVAAKWALELAQRATVVRTRINGCDTIIGIATDENRWMGIFKSPYKQGWDAMISSEIMERSTEFRGMLLSIAGEGDWVEGAIRMTDALILAKVVRNNWDWQVPEEERMPEVSDESLLDIVQLEISEDPAEGLFKQLPEAIREAVYNRLPTVGALPGCTSRGETLEEVADFCIQVAAEQAAIREADRLWDEWHIANPPTPARRRPRKPEGSKKAPRRKK